MSRAWHCDGPGCDTWTRGLGLDNWIMIVDDGHFCDWACLAAYAAGKPWVQAVRVIA